MMSANHSSADRPNLRLARFLQRRGPAAPNGGSGTLTRSRPV